MIKLHLKILEKEGKKEFAILPYKEFLILQEELDDYESLKALREAKAKEDKIATISLEDAKKELNIE